jgi:23S rRNA (uridine2552-2'-O)-methyltransferase
VRPKKTNPYLQDYFAKKAKKENFAARSAFKLEEIHKKYSLFKSGQKVLDLGAAPGSWSQYAQKMIGVRGSVIGIDLQPIKIQLPGAVFLQADLLAQPLHELLLQNQLSTGPFDVVLSDMAPKTTGVKFSDQMKSLELCEMALKTAMENLRPGGHFVCKLFHSDEFKGLKASISENFRQFHALKPQSTRSISKEIFLIGLGLKS